MLPLFLIYAILIIGDTMQMNVENIITYFKLKNINGEFEEYILYHNGIDRNNINMAKVVRENNITKLMKPSTDSLDILKKIIQNLISVNPNGFVFSQNKYQYIDLYYFNNKQVEVVDTQKVQLTDEQYSNMVKCKFLMYPYDNLPRKRMADSKTKYSALADTMSLVISSILMLLIIGGLVAYQFDWNLIKDGVFNLNNIVRELSLYDLYINNYLIIQLVIFTLLLSIIAYKSESSKPIIAWFGFTISLIVIFVLWNQLSDLKYFGTDYLNSIKVISLYSICSSTIITVAYTLCKEVVTLITKKFSLCNFVTYYAMFFILFTFSFIGLGLFYNNYLLEHVMELITKLI